MYVVWRPLTSGARVHVLALLCTFETLILGWMLCNMRLGDLTAQRCQDNLAVECILTTSRWSLPINRESLGGISDVLCHGLVLVVN
jgi:hypothetical protein